MCLSSFENSLNGKKMRVFLDSILLLSCHEQEEIRKVTFFATVVEITSSIEYIQIDILLGLVS